MTLHRQALARWHQFGRRSFQNPVLQAAYLEFLKPAGIVCDFFTFDPAADTLQEASCFELIRPKFEPNLVELPPMQELFAPLAAVRPLLTFRLESPHTLSIHLPAIPPARNAEQYHEAKALLADGYAALFNEFMEEATQGLMDSVNLTFRITADPKADPEMLTRFVSNPADFYREVVREMADGQAIPSEPSLP